MTVIYVVECIESNFVYVGCTVSKLNRRLNEHRSRLRKGIHTSTKMREDFNKYGSDSFKLRVVERLAKDASLEVKREAELRWLNHFGDQGRLYNAHIVSFSVADEIVKRARTPEANLKRRLAQLGIPKGHGAKISATKKALGQRPSLEAAKMGGVAACKVRWGKADEIV